MATTELSTIVDDVAAVAVGCPTPIILKALRDVAIDACSRAFLWPITLDDVTLTSSVAQYTFISPVSNTVVTSVLSARINNEPINILTKEQALSRYPEWPDLTNTSQPIAMFQNTETTYNILPTPDNATPYTLRLDVYLKPTPAATAIDSDVLNSYQDLIVYGALHRLLLQTKFDWADVNMAGYYGKQYSYKVNNARARALVGLDSGVLMALQRPFA